MHTTNEQRAIIKDVVYKMNIKTFNRNTEDKDLGMNDIARVTIRATHRLMLDAYRDNRVTGSIILIDKSTNETVASGMII